MISRVKGQPFVLLFCFVACSGEKVSQSPTGVQKQEQKHPREDREVIRGIDKQSLLLFK